MNKLLVLLSLLCISNSNSSLQRHIQELRADFPGIHIPIIMFYNKPDTKIRKENGEYRAEHAYCDLIYGTIHIRKEWWDSANYWEQKKVFYHEIGHCVFNLRHTEDLYNEFSIMNIKLSTVKKDGSNWNRLLDEFKNRIRLSKQQK